MAPESSKQHCDQLAQRLAGPQRPQALADPKLGELLLPAAAKTRAEKPAGQEPRPISIWTPTTEDGTLVWQRPEPSPLGDHYASRRRLVQNKAPGLKRLCYFGESAAAGYLFAPHLTPAMVLQDQLNQQVDTPGWEVIDLARTNEKISSMLQVLEASLQLSPDALCVYTGNNWNLLETPGLSPFFPDELDRLEFAQLLRKRGTEGPLYQALSQLTIKVTHLFSRIAELAQHHNIPVIVVIPEVNLFGWHDPQPPALLPQQQLVLWWQQYEQAIVQLQNKAWGEAVTTGLEMFKLDQGSASATYRILAEGFRGQGKWKAAREAAHAEIDAAAYPQLCFLGSPRITRAGRQLQQKLAMRFGFEVVDLAQVFYPEENQPIDDRIYFLDYCHLSLQGMTKAMAGVCEVLTKEKLPSPLPKPKLNPAHHALALFGAAIHSAHRQYPLLDQHELLQYWCDRALAVWPGIVQAMNHTIRARLSRLPEVLTQAQGENLNSQVTVLLQHGWRYDFLDLPLIAAMSQSMAAAGHEVDWIERELIRAHGIGHTPVNLAEPLYHWQPLARFFPEVMGLDDLNRKIYYRSPVPKSHFCLIYPGAGEVGLTLTARLPKSRRHHELKLVVNDQTIECLTLSEDWTTLKRRLPALLFKSGLNLVALHWPGPGEGSQDPIEAVCQRLEKNTEAPLHYVFGYVHGMFVNLCQD